jgi:hypothetical protein
LFPKPGSNVSYRSLKPQYGIEISISGLVKTLSKSSGTGTGSTNGKNTGKAADFMSEHRKVNTLGNCAF